MHPITAAGVAFLLVLAPQARSQCGDCNEDGGLSTVLDSLAAAKITAGLIMTPSAYQMVQCDVDSSLGIDMMDALVIAQDAVQLPVTLMCPNNPPDTNNCSEIDQGFGSSFLDYILTDSESDVCNLTLMWSTDSGVTWNVGTATGSRDGLVGLASSPAGTPHELEWDYGADIGPTCQITADLQLIPSDAFATGTFCTVSGIEICFLP